MRIRSLSAEPANVASPGRAAARDQSAVRGVSRWVCPTAPTGSGFEPRWLERNIRDPVGTDPRRRSRATAAVRATRRALSRLERRGLSRVVDRADYAGCFAPRRIPGSGSLSLHAWGLAIDINAAANPRLGQSRQDRRLVRAMEEAGFTWGGRWPTVPDPMHFELHPWAGRGFRQYLLGRRPRR